jgi:hypothetical protein
VTTVWAAVVVADEGEEAAPACPEDLGGYEGGATVVVVLSVVYGGDTAAPLGPWLGAGLPGVGPAVSLTGHTVVETAKVSVVTTVDSAGQLVTVAAHDVMVRVVVL